MKKIMSILILLILFFVITGCDKIARNDNQSEPAPSSVVEETSSEEEKPEPLRFPEGYVPDLDSWELKLVDVNNGIDEDYPVTLAPIAKYCKEGMRTDERIIDAVNAMLEDAALAGVELWVASSYRSIEDQRANFNGSVNKLIELGMTESEAYDETKRYIALPGHSEHQLGLAIDVISARWYEENDDINESFEDTPHFKWLEKNAANYGFVISYLRGKQEMTYNYEPWHFRYVGVEAARVMTDLKLCLQEFYMIANGEDVYPTSEEIKTTADISSTAVSDSSQ